MPSREEKKAQTRKKLLDAAAHLVAKQGAMATSLDQIAEKAGLTKGAVYSNFANKDELLVALGEELPAVDFGDFFDEHESLAENLERLGEVVTAEISRMSSRSWQLLLELDHYAQRNQRMRRRIVAEMRSNQEFSAEKLGPLMGDSQLTSEELHIIVDALSLGIAHRFALDPKSLSPTLLPKVFRLLAES